MYHRPEWHWPLAFETVPAFSSFVLRFLWKSMKNMIFYVFELLHTFSRKLLDYSAPHHTSSVNVPRDHHERPRIQLPDRLITPWICMSQYICMSPGDSYFVLWSFSEISVHLRAGLEPNPLTRRLMNIHRWLAVLHQVLSSTPATTNKTPMPVMTTSPSATRTQFRTLSLSSATRRWLQ